MKDFIDKASLAVVLIATVAILLIIFYAQDGRRSFWIIPLCLCSTTAVFCTSAFGSRQSFMPELASKALFWLSLVAAIGTTLIAASGGT
jgi:uncharacterized membrane protein YhaH (DUF805 family)